ncbi:MAG: hypothetical protein AB1465_06090, partial [Patescibacteria group bacterium]
RREQKEKEKRQKEEEERKKQEAKIEEETKKRIERAERNLFKNLPGMLRREAKKGRTSMSLTWSTNHAFPSPEDLERAVVKFCKENNMKFTFFYDSGMSCPGDQPYAEATIKWDAPFQEFSR